MSRVTPKKNNSSSQNGIKSRLHLGPMSDFKPWCPYLTPRTPSLPWPKVPAPRAPQRVRLELSRPPSQATRLWRVHSPGASPGLVTGYRACRWAGEGLRQELSLSGGCLVTLMENELWGPNPRSHSRSWRAHRKARVPQQGEGHLQKSCPRRLCVGGGGDGQRSAEPKEGLDQGLDLLAA